MKMTPRIKHRMTATPTTAPTHAPTIAMTLTPLGEPTVISAGAVATTESECVVVSGGGRSERLVVGNGPNEVGRLLDEAESVILVVVVVVIVALFGSAARFASGQHETPAGK